MKKTNKNVNTFLKLSGLGIQMGAIIYLFSYLGTLLDTYFNTNSKTYTLVMAIVGFVFSLISLLAQLKKMENDG